jgi:hypothetical protein
MYWRTWTTAHLLPPSPGVNMTVPLKDLNDADRVSLGLIPIACDDYETCDRCRGTAKVPQEDPVIARLVATVDALLSREPGVATGDDELVVALAAAKVAAGETPRVVGRVAPDGALTTLGIADTDDPWPDLREMRATLLAALAHTGTFAEKIAYVSAEAIQYALSLSPASPRGAMLALLWTTLDTREPSGLPAGSRLVIVREAIYFVTREELAYNNVWDLSEMLRPGWPCTFGMRKDHEDAIAVARLDPWLWKDVGPILDREEYAALTACAAGDRYCGQSAQRSPVRRALLDHGLVAPERGGEERNRYVVTTRGHVAIHRHDHHVATPKMARLVFHATGAMWHSLPPKTWRQVYDASPLYEHPSTAALRDDRPDPVRDVEAAALAAIEAGFEWFTVPTDSIYEIGPLLGPDDSSEPRVAGFAKTDRNASELASDGARPLWCSRTERALTEAEIQGRERYLEEATHAPTVSGSPRSHLVMLRGEVVATGNYADAVREQHRLQVEQQRPAVLVRAKGYRA